MDLRRIVRTPDGGLRGSFFLVLILAAPAAVLGLATLGGWMGTLGIAMTVVAGLVAMIRYGNG